MGFLKKQWFLIVLIGGLFGGFTASAQLQSIADLSWLKWSIVSMTLFLMTLPLEFDRLFRAVSRPKGPFLATGINLVLVPLLAWPLSRLLGSELGPGLIVAAAVPSTLASGAVWTRRAGGDDSVALTVTILTNSICFLVTPVWVYFLIGVDVDRTVFIQTIFKLLFFVVVPMFLGQLARVNSRTACWATQNKPTLATVAQFGILAIVTIGAVKMGVRVDETGGVNIAANQLALMLLIVLALHLSVLAIGLHSSRWLGLPRDQQIAVGFSASQKTLMVGLSTAISMGLSIIPLIAYHSIQLIVDTLIADRFKANDAHWNHSNKKSS